MISAIAAVFWGRGLAAAKDETIRTKEAQIDALRSRQEETLKAKEAEVRALERQVEYYRELSPMRLREYVLNLRSLAEERIKDLEERLIASRVATSEKDAEITRLRVDGEARTAEIERLEAEINHLERDQVFLKEQLRAYQKTEEAITTLEKIGVFGRFARVWNGEKGEWQIRFSMDDAHVIGSEPGKPSS